MLSMLSPFSSFFSISTISLTPSTTSWTCSTSEEPRRSALEMSNTPPTEAVSTPPKEKGQKSESQWRFHWAVQAGPQAYEGPGGASVRQPRLCQCAPGWLWLQCSLPSPVCECVCEWVDD
uniref:Uncharacterized protein n=1 Tax=Maylandia zebra TaxID=106582 RepID=A0A3P9DB56_9CICH